MTVDISMKPLEASKPSELAQCQSVVSIIITQRLEIQCYKIFKCPVEIPTKNIAVSLLTHIVPSCKLEKDAPLSRPNPKLVFTA